MTERKAFVLVGHAHWGKSSTLRELLPGSAKRQAWTQLDGEAWIFIKRMSNDDVPDSLLDFVRTIGPDEKPNVIVALCPDFEDNAKKTELIVGLLEKKYSLTFVVLKEKWDGSDRISSDQIDALRKFGTVQILSERDFRARGVALRRIIISSI